MIRATLLTVQYMPTAALGDKITVGVLGLDASKGEICLRNLDRAKAVDVLVPGAGENTERLMQFLNLAVKKLQLAASPEDLESRTRALFYDKGLSVTIGQEVSMRATSLESALDRYLALTVPAERELGTSLSEVEDGEVASIGDILLDRPVMKRVKETRADYSSD